MNTRPSLVDRSILTSPPQIYSVDNGMPKGLSITASGADTVTTAPSSQNKSKKGIFLNIFLVLVLGAIGFFLWKRSKTYKPPLVDDVVNGSQEIKPINY
jgi:hypothetical protein